MTIRVAINGYGRIGRSILRAVFERGLEQQIRIVAINDLATPHSIEHLTRFDSTHGRFNQPVDYIDREGVLQVGQSRIALLHQPELSALPWRTLDVDIVFECTGRYKSRADAGQHLAAGAKKVLFSQPAASDLDNTVIFGVNHHSLQPEQRIVSNGSCTTNCIVPVIDTLDREFGVERGTITTIHSAMHDQPVIDAHHHDLRLARSAMQSIIPVDTRLAQGIERILPRFAGKFEAIAMRVPTVNVTAMTLNVVLKKQASTQAVNQAFRQAARGPLTGILDYTDAPVVSVDFNHDSHSAIIDGSQCRVSDGHLVNVLAWCDNEWGFANRMLDTAWYMMHGQSVALSAEPQSTSRAVTAGAHS